MKLIPALAVEQEVRQLEREAASGRAELDALRGKHEQVRTHPAVPMQTLESGGSQQADGRDLRPFLPRRLRLAAVRSVSITASISFVEHRASWLRHSACARKPAQQQRAACLPRERD